MHSGRAWASDTITVTQGDRLLSRGLVLLNTVEPDLMRHAPTHARRARPRRRRAQPADHCLPGRETRTVDAPDAVGADGSPAMYFWMRNPESYDSVAANQAIVAWTQPGSSSVWRCGRTRVNIADAHRTISTGVISHTAHFHDHADVGDWLLVAQQASYAGNGRVFGSGAVFTQDGTLVSTFAQDSMARAWTPRSTPSGACSAPATAVPASCGRNCSAEVTVRSRLPFPYPQETVMARFRVGVQLHPQATTVEEESPCSWGWRARRRRSWRCSSSSTSGCCKSTSPARRRWSSSTRPRCWRRASSWRSSGAAQPGGPRAQAHLLRLLRAAGDREEPQAGPAARPARGAPLQARALHRESTEAYIKHRLRLAGAPADAFTPEALGAVHQHSGGPLGSSTPSATTRSSRRSSPASRTSRALESIKIAENLGLSPTVAQTVADTAPPPTHPPRRSRAPKWRKIRPRRD